MCESVRTLLRWAGSGLAVLGVLFIVLRIRQYGAQIDVTSIGGREWLVTAGLALLYGAANALLALAWWRLLLRAGVPSSFSWALRTYGISQLAKYLPGNIFHMVGRQSLGMAAGWPAKALVGSIFLELVLLAGAGALFGALLLPLVLPEVGWGAGGALWVLGVTAANACLRRFLGVQAGQAALSLVVFLLISAAIFVALVILISPSSSIGANAWPTIAGAFVIAWLAGLVTPGAPAGVGVRELVLLLFLKSWVAEADLLLAVLLGRLVTVCGDLFFFLVALSLRGMASGKDK